MTAATETRADLSAADVNDLPDSAFAFIEPGGTKDAGGKTTPRSKRHFPIQDKAHVQNALARMGQSPFGAKAKPKILAAAQRFGIEVSDDDSRAAQAPLELRKRRRMTIGGVPERRALLFDIGMVELRAKPSGHGTTNYEFNGYAVVYEHPFEMWDQWGDPYDENVETRACAPSVARPDLNTPFLIGHDDGGIALARTKSGTMRLSDDSHGLAVNVPDLDGRSPLVQSLASAIERRDMDEMSVGFVCRRQQWSPDYAQRNIQEMDIHRGDVSIVVTAANPATAGATLTVPGLEATSARRRTEQRTPTQPYVAHKGETNECPVCHSVNADSSKFCDQCGHSMQPVSHVNNMAGVEDMTQQCSSCSQANSADAKYCCNCGHELATDRGTNGYSDWSAGRPLEQRAQDEIVDTSKQPDFNVATDNPAANGVASVKCPYTKTNGCGQMCPGSSKFCPNCGGPVYDGDGTLVVDDSGVVESSEGDADMLSLRLRLLELA